MRFAFVLGAVLMASPVGLAPALASDDPAVHIRKLMADQFDKPEQRLQVDPVVVVSDHAIAGWVQGDMGGRALLRRKGHAWHIVLCSGDQLKSADTLIKVGIAAAAANQLAASLAAAEAKTDPARLAMFAKFDGILMLDGSGHHPPAGHHAPAGHHPPHGAPAHKPPVH